MEQTQLRRHKKDLWQFFFILFVLLIFAYYENRRISGDTASYTWSEKVHDTPGNLKTFK